jgi:hypothetical protein
MGEVMTWVVGIILLGLSTSFYFEITGIQNITRVLVWTVGLLFLMASISDSGEKLQPFTTFQNVKLWVYKTCVMFLALVLIYYENPVTGTVLLIESIYVRKPLS